MGYWPKTRRAPIVASIAFALALTFALRLPVDASAAPLPSPELVSVAMDGSATGGVDSGSMGISADGRYATFASSSPDLVPNDTNGAMDVFVRDRVDGTTTRVSVASDGSETVPPFFPLSGGSGDPAISADGRYVVFRSGADNLYPWREHCGPWCPGELDGNLYVHDMLTDTTSIVGTASDGTPANRGVSRGPVLSANGRYVAFSSDATNLVPESSGDLQSHVYVKDLQTDAITRISVMSDGQVSDPPPSISTPLAISDDGGVVVLESSAALDPAHPVASVYVWHRATGTTDAVGCCWGGFRSLPGGISGDGRVFGVNASSQPTAAYWPLDAFAPAGLTAVPGSTGPPLLNEDGSRFFFQAFDDRAGDGLGPGIFAVARTGGPVSRLTAVATLGMFASTRDGRHFGGTTRERLLANDANDEIDAYVQDRINQAPTIAGVPNDIFVTTRGTTAIVGYPSPSANDPEDGPLPVACSPTSGSTFPLGETAVRCTATDSSGEDASASFSVTVSSIRPRVLTQPVDQTIVADQIVAFSATASGTPPPTIQWQERTLGGVWTDVLGATSTTYAFLATAAQSQHRFRAVFTNVNGTANTAAAILTVQVPPTITAQPADATVRAGHRATFTADADGSPRASVQWQRSDDGVRFTNVPGATSRRYTLTATSTDDGSQYHAVFTNPAGTATTQAATLSIRP